MRLLIRSQLRYLTRTKGSTIASAAGIALGVMSVVAVHLVSDRIKAELDRNVLLVGYTHVLQGALLTEDAYFDIRDQWRAGGFDHIDAMVPVVEGYALVDGSKGRLVRIVGVDTLADWRPGGSDFGRDSTRADSPGVPVSLITRDSVLAGETLGYVAGDTVRLGDTLVEVVGVLEGGQAWFFADIATAQKVLDRSAPTAIWIRSGRDVPTIEHWFPGITAAFDRATSIDFDNGMSAGAIDDVEPTRRFALAIVFNLGALGFLAIFVAAFLIYQSSHANVMRRARDRERLVAIGVGPAALRGLFVGEGALLGLMGAAVGTLLGWGMAVVLVSLPFPSSEPVVLSAVAVVKGVASGVGIGVIGALAASRSTRSRLVRWIVVVLALAVMLVAASATNLAAAFGIILAMCALQISLLVPVSAAVLKRLFESSMVRFGMTQRANVRFVSMKLAEIDIAASALSIAVAAAIGMGVMVENFRRDFVQLLDQRLWEAVYLEGADAVDVAWLEQLPGVTAVRRYAMAPATMNGRAVDATLGAGDALETRRYGYGGALADEVLLSEVGARLYGVAVGDVVDLAGARGVRKATVAHVFADYGAAMPRIIGTVDHLAPLFDAVSWNRMSLLTDVADNGDLKRRIGQRYPGVVVRDHVEIRRRAVEVFDRTFEITSGLTLIALVVAVVGLYNALSALQLRRRGENRLLYTLGVSRGRIAALGVQQNALIGAVAAVLAIPLGLAIAYVLCTLVNPRAFGWSISFALDVPALAAPVLLGIVAALLAGMLPTYRAMKTLTGSATYEL